MQTTIKLADDFLEPIAGDADAEEARDETVADEKLDEDVENDEAE